MTFIIIILVAMSALIVLTNYTVWHVGSFR